MALLGDRLAVAADGSEATAGDPHAAVVADGDLMLPHEASECICHDYRQLLFRGDVLGPRESTGEIVDGNSPFLE